MSIKGNVENEVVDIHGSIALVLKGDDGESAYEVAVRNGFVGTEAEWLASLKGEADRAEAATAEALVWQNSAKDYAVEAGNHEEAAKGYRNECQTIKDSIAPQVTQAISAIQAEKAEAEAKKALVDVAAANANLDRIQADADAAEVRYLYNETIGQKNVATDAAERARLYAEGASTAGYEAAQQALATKLDVDGTAVNAEKVNGLTVETAVPANAVFTDTTYHRLTAEEAAEGTATTARTITAKVLADYVADVVATAVTSLVNSSPATLDTLKELADAIGEDPNFATTMTTALAGKLGKTETAKNAEKVNNLTVETAVPANAVFTDTTYDNATTSTAGLMSATDKAKLDGVESGAQVNTITGVKGNAESNYRVGNVNITKTDIGLGNVENTADSAKSVLYAATAGDAATVNNLMVQTAVPANAVFTDTTYSNFVGSGSTAAAGLVPAPSTTAGTAKYLREDGTWQVPPDNNTTYSNATTSAAGLMSATDKTILDGVPTTYATLTDMNTLATTATNSVTAAVNAKNDAVAAKNQAQSIADGLASIRDTAVDTSLAISGQAADSKTVGDKFAVIGATSATNNEYLCVWLDSANRVLFGVKADGSFYWQKGIPKVLKDELDGIKARLSALEG